MLLTISKILPEKQHRYRMNADMWKAIEFQVSFRSFRDFFLRKNLSGDAVVGHTSKNQRYPTFQNVKVDLRYPASGYGKMITYVEIAVNQTSTQGYAQITQGDVGQHFIAISVYATNTYQMDYSAIIYGI